MIKRIFDIFLASILLIILSPLIVITALVVRYHFGSPILFRQLRPGLHGKAFEMIKFRSMTETTNEQGNILPDAQRLTRVGAFLRASSLDELPELWNVIRGQMSMVGPRPLLMEYLPLYNKEQNRRHDMRPGITGLTQIKGRNWLSWEEKFALDLWYIDNHSFWLDLKILMYTIQKVLLREGITSKGCSTVEKFTGNKY